MAGLLLVFAVLTYVGSDALVHRFVDGWLPVRHVFISIPRQEQVRYVLQAETSLVLYGARATVL